MSVLIDRTDQGSPITFEIPQIASGAPAKRLASLLEADGHSESSARALARAIVDPAAARRKYPNPTVFRTPTALLFALPVDVWAPLISTLPENKREAPSRRLPVDGGSTYPALPDAVANDCSPEVVVHAHSSEQLAASLLDSQAYLELSNDLSESIAEEGVLMPVTLIAMRVDFERGDPAITFAASEDGSSRIASAHRLLGLKPADVLFRFGQDDRAFRRHIGDLRARQASGRVTDEERKRLRALIAPAFMIIRVEPLPGVRTTTAEVMRAYVGLLHVSPPKKWTDGAILDAQGDEVLDELSTNGSISPEAHSVMAGRVTVEQAQAMGIVGTHDERAALVLRTFVDSGDLVSRAIRRVMHISRVETNRRVDVACELMLRSYRAREPEREMRRSRTGIQRAFRMGQLWKQPWEATRRSPEELLDASLRELRAGQLLGPSSLELAVKGGFELTRVRALAIFSMRFHDAPPSLDDPQVLLRNLASSEHGLRILCQAVRSGRAGARDIQAVKESGELEYADGRPVVMSDEWLRRTFGRPKDEPSTAAGVSTPASTLAEMRMGFSMQVNVAVAKIVAIQEIREAGATKSLVEMQGWPRDEAEELASKLDGIAQTLRYWGFVHRSNNDDQAGPETLAEFGFLPADSSSKS